MPDSLNAVLIVALLIAPGYIMLATLRPRIHLFGKQSDIEFVVATVAAGVVIQSMCYPLLGEGVVRDWGDKDIDHVGRTIIWLFLSLLLLPVLLGWLLAWAVNSNAKVVRWVTTSDQDRIARAWIYSHRNRKSCYVRVWLNDDAGTVIGGKYGNKSLVSTDMSYPDLYLEEAWMLDEDGWYDRKMPNSGGVWLSPSSIQRIEFTNEGEAQ